MLQVLTILIAVLLTLPVELDIRADLNVIPSYLFIIRVYGFSFTLAGPFKPRPAARKKTKAKNRLLLRRTALRTALELVRRKPAAIAFSGRVGTGDAALTALGAGILQTALAACNAFAPTHTAIAPDFFQTVFWLSARCMLSLRGGEIIRTGALAFVQESRAAWREKRKNGKQTH